ncbi:hypothetical protein ABEB36_006994 [Hypothenemus hampei]|uniref:Zinc carboxypeptidase A 1 n=1 Tax=Hypothenemus hampei TaxID=57062 RepID=A0ABD1ESX1_HYPHA
MVLLTLILELLIIALVNSNYTGYKVYKVVPDTFEQLKAIDRFHYQPHFDFWQDGTTVGQTNNIMVAPKDQSDFEADLLKNKLNFEISVDDVESFLNQEKQERLMTRTFLSLGQVTFQSYMFYSEHMAYLRRLANDYPQIVTLDKIGESYEGRDLLLIHISSGPSDISKPVIFIDAGIHCREWISPPVALYIIQQLVENPENSYLYQNVDWYILPSLNPDGYEYTQTHNRLWRKNRRLTAGAECYGTDLNRNFDYMWMFDGASQDSCTEIYAGPEAFSEPETQALRNWFLNNTELNIKLYLTFHSYGEMMLYPWGYARVLPENFEELHRVGELAANAIGQATRINSNYLVNSSAILLYPAAGGSDDWVKAIAGVDLAYCVELPDGDAPFFFMLPARQILPVVQETFEGVKAFHSYIEETYWNENL